jgi:hypothetical protein
VREIDGSGSATAGDGEATVAHSYPTGRSVGTDR